MNSTVMILAFCTAAAFSISIKKGLMPFWEQKKEMALQKAEFSRFLEIIRRLSGKQEHGRYLRKIAHPDDTMYRALRKHTFLYRGGIPSFDETLKREGQLLPCEVVVYSDEENLYLIYGKLISMKAPLTDRMLKEQCFVLSNVNGVTIRKLESASKQAGVEILYNNGSFIMENYMWSEEFLQEKIAVEINDAHAFFFKSLKSAKKEQEDICGEATLAQYKGLIESFAEKWAGKGA